MTNLKCHCGYYHYTIQHWSEIHGETKEYIDPYIQVPFVGDNVWNEQEHNSTEPYPLITRKWVCQFCGQTKSHDNNCSYFLNYQEFFQPFSGKREQIIPNYPVKGSTAPLFTSPPEPQPKSNNKSDEENTKRTLTGWNKVREINFHQWKQLVKIVDPQDEFTLTDLLSLLPLSRPSTPTFITPDSSRSPSPDPFEKQKNFEYWELSQLFDKYLTNSPFFSPDNEINDLGFWENKWVGSKSWVDYLWDSGDNIELQDRKQYILKLFGRIMITHFLKEKDLPAIDKFKLEHSAYYPHELEKEVVDLRKGQKPETKPKKEKEAWIKKEGGWLGIGGKDKDYSDISIDFTTKPELIEEWNAQGFYHSQVKEWISIGMKIEETDLVGWLANKHGYKSDDILNYADITQLRKLFGDLTIAYQKLNFEIPCESWETQEGLEKWIREINDKVKLFVKKPSKNN